jgi:quercetin dioxygenase-like cupin family protein
MKTLFAVLALSCLSLFAQDAAKPAPAPVEVAAEPDHHLKLENEYVRAYYVEVAPGQSTLMHHHGTDYVSVTFGAAEVDILGADGSTRHASLQDGQVTYAPAGVVHAAADKSSTPFRNATIELLQNQGHPVCVKNCDSDPRAKDWPALLDSEKAIGYGDSFRIIAVDIKPQQTVPLTTPFPHLGAVLSDTKGTVTVAGQAAQGATHSPGEIMFHQPHPEGMTLTNTGTQDIRLVEIQFKPVKP